VRDADELCGAPLAELSGLIAEREVSVSEVVAAHLERIERVDPILHPFLTVMGEQARRDALTLDAEFARGRSRGPLHGIPIALKDLFDTAGVRTTGNSRLFQDRISRSDATVVTRLRAAGAVVIGKLKLHELAIAPARRDDYFVPALNPWDRAHVPGGSSSGSAVALSAGLCAGSLGSDTGGSIRTPSAMVGVVGLKPTYGLVSRHGILHLSWSLDHVGPMARTVRDTAMLLQAIAGHDPLDAASSRNAPVTDYTGTLDRPITGLRIGVPWPSIRAATISPVVLAAFDESLSVFERAGAEVTDVVLPFAEHSEAIQAPIRGAEMFSYHQRWLQSRPELYGADARHRILEGLVFSGADYLEAQRARTVLARQFGELLTRVDVLAMPTLQSTAPSFQQVEVHGFTRSPFTGLFNLSGQPALSLPCGFDQAGLPIGLMLTGRAFDETTLLRVAHAYESATPWHTRRPRSVWPEARG
jgi:aspartyl-tRNA(Asn)/glutamyl-tRNA(Gln) amidotransferase subunit A